MTPATHTDLTTRRVGLVTVIEFLDRRLVDAVQIQRVGEQVQAAVEAANPPLIVIGFEKVEFLSSGAVGVLIAAERAIRDRKGQLRLAGVNADLKKLFSLLKLTKLAKQCDTVNEAVRSFES